MIRVTRTRALGPRLLVSKSVARLVPKPPRIKGAGRRAQYSASTKRALIEVATELFAEHGYASTSLDAIVAGARVTKGALYHHFTGKRALFEAVFEQVERAASKSIHDQIKGERDPWEKARTGLRAFLEVVRDPTYRGSSSRTAPRSSATSGSASRKSARRSPTCSRSSPRC